MGPRAGQDKCGKISPPPGFDPRTVQSVVSRYTDLATGPTNQEVMEFNWLSYYNLCARDFGLLSESLNIGDFDIFL